MVLLAAILRAVAGGAAVHTGPPFKGNALFLEQTDTRLHGLKDSTAFPWPVYTTGI